MLTPPEASRYHALLKYADACVVDADKTEDDEDRIALLEEAMAARARAAQILQGESSAA